MNGADAGHRRPRIRAKVVALLVILAAATVGCAGQSADGPTGTATSVSSGAGSTTPPTVSVATSSEAVPAAPSTAPQVSSDATNPEPDDPSTTTAVEAVPTLAGPSSAVGTGIAGQQVAAAPMPGSQPVRLEIPALGVDAGLLDLGLQDDGTLEVPPDAASVGWFTGGPSPGALGPAVIVGHVDWAGELGLFYYLKDLTSQDEITVTRADGSQARFRVTSNEAYPKDEFPTDAVYGNIDHAGLRLITCGGEFDRQARSYTDNIIVFADLIGTSAP